MVISCNDNYSLWSTNMKTVKACVRIVTPFRKPKLP